MKQLRREGLTHGVDHGATNKETRWDRIRKRCTAGASGSGATFSLKTETVRRFIESDFIGKRNTSLMHGEQNMRKALDPTLVMNMRHEMFQKIPRKLPLATAAKKYNLYSCRAHNMAVEQRFIDNELNKLRQQLEKDRKRSEIKFQHKSDSNESKDLLFVDNKMLMESLEASSIHIEDFYATPMEAFNEIEALCQLNDTGLTQAFNENTNEDDNDDNAELKSARSVEELAENEVDLNVESELAITNDDDDEQTKLEETIKFQVECRTRAIAETDAQYLEEFVRRTPSPLTPTDEFLKPMRDAATKHQAEVRRVRFEDEVNVHKLERENSSCSNTSDGLDSIISDLAEEALLELQMEEQEELKNRNREQKVNEHVAENEHDEKIEKEHLKCQISSHQETPTLKIIGEKTMDKTLNEELLLIKPIQIQMTNKHAEKYSNEKNDLQPSITDDEEETLSTHEQNLIIEQLFQARAHTNIVTMRKYFLKWIHYTTISKIERENTSNKNDRIHQINAFLDKIRKEKVRIAKHTKEADDATKKPHESNGKPMQHVENIQTAKKYQSKIKMQQDIIDLQRLKLERQERLIMELKLKKLSDEAKEARQEIKNELKAVIRSGDEKSKAKAKCLQLIGNLRDSEDEDDFKRLQGKALLMPKFLQKMQERALERSIRHEQARQRRLQQEAEREAQKIAVEEAKRLEDEEAKRMRIEALKEKRRQEKVAKVLKERERQRAIENNKKAHEFNRHRLLKRIGMEGFQRLIQRKREYMRKSEALRQRVIKRSYFIAWLNYYRFELSRRIQRADKLHCILIKRQTLKLWLRFVSQERSKFYVAIDWYDMKLSTFMFKEWADYTKRMKKIEESKMRKAISHYEWNLKFKVIDCWQRLPQILQLEKETEERRQRWRMKIWELLPDYTPRLDAFV